MSSITCRVVDFNGSGCAGMRVNMLCHSLEGRISEFDAHTTSDGSIHEWQSCNSSEKKVVDAREYEHISVTFLVGAYFGQLTSPWVTIQSQFIPEGSHQHLISLHVGAARSYSLNHTTTVASILEQDIPKRSIEMDFEEPLMPSIIYLSDSEFEITSPVNYQFSEDTSSTSDFNNRSIPLSLPSPHFEHHQQSGIQCRLPTSYRHPPSNFKKRKVRFDDEETERLHPRKRQRLE